MRQRGPQRSHRGERHKPGSLHTNISCSAGAKGCRDLWFRGATPEEESAISCVAPAATLFRFFHPRRMKTPTRTGCLGRTLIIPNFLCKCKKCVFEAFFWPNGPLLSLEPHNGVATLFTAPTSRYYHRNKRAVATEMNAAGYSADASLLQGLKR